MEMIMVFDFMSGQLFQSLRATVRKVEYASKSEEITRRFEAARDAWSAASAELQEFKEVNGDYVSAYNTAKARLGEFLAVAEEFMQGEEIVDARLQYKLAQQEMDGSYDALCQRERDLSSSYTAAKLSFESVNAEYEELKAKYGTSLSDDSPQTLDEQIAVLSDESKVILEFVQGWTSSEQHYYLTALAGRYRQLRELNLSSQQKERNEASFRRIVEANKRLWTGHIGALTFSFTTDWSSYISEAQRTLEQIRAELARREQLGEMMDAVQSAKVKQQAVEEAERAEATHYKRVELKAALDAGDYDVAVQVILSMLQPPCCIKQNDPCLLEEMEGCEDIVAGVPELSALWRNLTDASVMPAYRGPTPVSGARAVLIGGAPSAVYVNSIREALRLDELEVIKTCDHGTGKVAAAAERLANGTLDFAIVQCRFISHKVTDQLSSVQEKLVMLSHGSGVRTAVEAVLEKFADATVC
jgi:hypothetical protein